MYKAWRIIRTLSAFAGFSLLIMAVGTSDYYVMELGQNEPGSVWTTIAIGFALILPAFIHAIYKEWKEGQEDVQD